MIVKVREESDEIKILTSLNNRMNLSQKDKLYFHNIKKGFEGEVLFDSYLEKLRSECLIINDLLFKLNHTTFQIDSLMIMSDTIFVFEVKNFEGDYVYDANTDKIYPNSSEVDILNPVTQMKRSETLLSQLLSRNGFKFPIKSFVIFINPEFTLYQAPLDKPIVYPTQIKRFLKKFDAMQSRITNKHKLLAEKLISFHMPEPEHTNIPSFEYDQLEKGITCAACGSFFVTAEGRSCICSGCGHRESVHSAVMRGAREFKLLFPDRKITTSRIFDWCQVVESKKRIRTILDKNLKASGIQRWTYYE